jgi:hypothetical protein
MVRLSLAIVGGAWRKLPCRLWRCKHFHETYIANSYVIYFGWYLYQLLILPRQQPVLFICTNRQARHRQKGVSQQLHQKVICVVLARKMLAGQEESHWVAQVTTNAGHTALLQCLTHACKRNFKTTRVTPSSLYKSHVVFVWNIMYEMGYIGAWSCIRCGYVTSSIRVEFL